MSRPTIEVVTSGGNKIILNEYLTGRDTRNIQKPFYDMAGIDMENKKMKDLGLKGDAIERSEDALIRACVVSVNDENDNVIDALLDLPASEYEEIMKIINEIQAGMSEERKKKLNNPS